MPAAGPGSTGRRSCSWRVAVFIGRRVTLSPSRREVSVLEGWTFSFIPGDVQAARRRLAQSAIHRPARNPACPPEASPWKAEAKAHLGTWVWDESEGHMALSVMRDLGISLFTTTLQAKSALFWLSSSGNLGQILRTPHDSVAHSPSPVASLA